MSTLSLQSKLKKKKDESMADLLFSSAFHQNFTKFLELLPSQLLDSTLKSFLYMWPFETHEAGRNNNFGCEAIINKLQKINVHDSKVLENCVCSDFTLEIIYFGRYS